jgi:hypothetical protein
MHQKLRAGMLALVTTFAAMAAPALAARPARPGLKDLVAALGGDAAHAQAARYAYLRKLDSHLQELAAGQGVSAGGPLAPRLGGVKVTPGNRVLVDVYVHGDLASASRRLRALGMDVRAIGRRTPQRMVEGYVPLDAVTKVAALAATKAVVPVTGEVTDTGSVLSEGDASQHGPQARALGASGAGVTVGVISDSMNHVAPGVAGSQGTGDLPANVTVLHDGSGASEDEGRAMAEIVYDEAPGITHMLFDTGSGGPATKAAHISELVASGAKVIADDVSELSEPFFQDGQVAQAVDAAKAAGTAYFASAGNRARQSWEGTFVPGAGNDNDFGGGDVEQSIVTVPAGATLFGVLQWDEPWGGATTDLDALLLVNGTVFDAGSGETDNIASGIPSESFGVTAGGSPIAVSLRINRFAGTATPKMKYIIFDNFGAFTIAEHNTNSPAINPDAASARGSLAAAAVCWSTSAANCVTAGLGSPEAFSSRGPVVRTRDAAGNPLASPETRQKPNVAGADGVSTDLAPGSGLNPFFGTSAATPSVAGVAALALSANPSLTVDQLYALLTNPANALDCTSALGVPDTDCGAGFIQADRVVTAAKTPPSVAAALSPAVPDGANGWYRSPVGVSWQVTDLTPATLTTTGCGPTTLTSDGITTLTCSAASAGGSKSASVTIKHDGSPPTGLAFSGIAAKAYKLGKAPRKSRIHCSASDPTSGVTGCTFTGYSSRQGAHRLKATATNGAGATSTKSLSYKVGCVVPKLKGKTLSKAKRALKKANCTVGKVKGSGVVKSSSPAAGKSPRKGSKVNLTLRRR